jgi:hypothetical protein
MNISESIAWTDPVPLIDEGDPLSNAEFLATAQALTNRTAFLASLVAGAGGNKTFAVRLDPIHNQDDRFGQTLSSKHFFWDQDATSVGGLYLPIDMLPDGVRLISATMRWTGARTGTHTTLPSTMPAIEVSYQDDIADTQIASQSDTSGSVGVYDVPHDVTVTLDHNVAPAPRQYFITITGETGGTIGTAVPSLYAVYITLGPVP